MNRCLHITLQERCGVQPRRAGASQPGGTGSDPGTDYFMPRPDDPGTDYFMPQPDDPGTDYFMPRPDDPGYASVPSGGLTSDQAAVAGPCCCAVDKTGPKPFTGPQGYSGFVIVRMAPGFGSTGAGSLWQLAGELDLPGLKAALQLARRGLRRSYLVSSRLVDLPAADIYKLERTAATSPFPPRHSLTAYWRLDLRERPGLAEKVVAHLNRLAEVDLAYRELAATDPQTAAIDGQDFAEDQGYLAAAPMGTGAAWVWHSLGAQPLRPLTLCDLEQGWTLSQEDLRVGPATQLLLGDNRADDEPGSGDHGTAVLGQLVATGSSELGVKGAAAGLGPLVLASHYKAKGTGLQFAGTNGWVAEAILRALSASPPLAAGDVLLLEVQRGLLPTEIDEADFDAIRLAAGLGVIVVEAAGNGGFDLDAYSDPTTGRSLRPGDPRFRDSGAILVGAARAGLPHDRAPFSNYGSRVECFGWGEGVTTCGYGNLARTSAASYTNSFTGTSSAAPVIAGAAALLQSLHETQTGLRLEPRALREILADPVTGTRQGPNVPGPIGVMPDLKAIVRDRLQLVPVVYLRRSLGDCGAPPSPGDEISSSPDILVSCQDLTTMRSRFGAGSPGESLAAPGGQVAPGAGDIYLRLRNRGLGAGTAHVQLFASPAATLITPERWLAVSPGGFNVGSPIPQGDTQSIAGPFHWTPPASGTISVPWSLLAIVSVPTESAPPGLPSFDGTAGMPPGPPYFDWAEYRAFLRGPGVAWRNTHHDSSKHPTLPFFIAGTPDSARHFDFEVIQRLPAGTKVRLQVPAALAAKLRQRQPWLGGGAPLLELPQRPRTAIRGVELAAGAWAAATFTVTVDPHGPSLAAGHSLALRQLWRGEEVGRITWFFGPA